MEMQGSYNFFLVALSFLVAVFGSYTSLMLISGLQERSGGSKYVWVAFAAVALGGGAIWTMHFIGMLAYETSMPTGYDIGWTFVSLMVAIFIVGLGISLVSSDKKSMSRLLIAGFITGLGVASMHYVGMDAMIMAADMIYDPVLVAVSVLIAIVASIVAFWLAFNLNGNMQRFVSALVMGVAVCGMHYTGMAAMTMIHNASKVVAIDSSMEPLTLGLFIFCFSMLLLVICLIVALANLNKSMYEQMERDEDEDDKLVSSGSIVSSVV